MPATPETPDLDPAVDTVDTRYMETLTGYNARRAAHRILEPFAVRMAAYDLRPADLSILSLVLHNPGITSRQLSAALGILPPNLVNKISMLEKRDLIERRPHPQDGRAVGLHLTASGEDMTPRAERTAFEMEEEATSRLSAAEKKTLIRLLQKIYL